MSSQYLKPKRTQLAQSFHPYYPVSPNADVTPYLGISQTESQALYCTTTEGKMLVDSLVRYVVGKGLTPMASPETKLLGWDEETTRRFQEEAEAYFRQVTGRVDFDWYGKNTFAQLQRIAFKGCVVNGDILIHRGYRRGKEEVVKPYLQLISGRMVSQVSESDTKDSVGGVVYDKSGREIAYKIRTLDNIFQETGGYQTVNRINSKTGKVEFDLIQINQGDAQIARGIPWLTPLRDEILGLSKYSQNHIAQSTIDTLFTAFITSQGEVSSTPFRDKIAEIAEQETDRKMNLGSGAIIQLDPGEDVKFGEKTTKGDDYATYVASNIDRMASAFGMNAEVAMGDFKASFSASKGSLAVAEKTFEIFRNEFAVKFCEPVWRQVVELGILEGKINAPGYLENKDAVLAVTWTGVTAPMIDPSKEINSLINAVNAGVIDKETVTRLLFGKDFDEVLERRAKEKQQEDAAGLMDNIQPVNGKGVNTSEEQREGEEEDERGN